jgi:hypothetical protein
MKSSRIALFAMILASSQLIGCAATGSTPAGDADSPTSATDTTTKTTTAPAAGKPAAGGAEPECE